MAYIVQMDFDEPERSFADLGQLFEALKVAGHIFIHDASHEKYQQMAEECGIDPAAYPFYVETSVTTEGIFVQDVTTWIETHMLGEFYNPENRPHIEKYL